MKKLVYLIVMMFTMVSLTSCEKEPIEDPIDNFIPIITLEELEGYWEFQKVVYDQIPNETHTYDASTPCYLFDEVDGLEKIDFQFRPFVELQPPMFDMFSDCYINDYLSNVYFEYKNNQIIMEYNNGTLEVLSYDKSTNTVELKLVVKFNNVFDCVGAVYTLKKI